MGTLAYAVGGGMAGLGHGLEEAGKQAHDEQMLEKQNDLATNREETIARLKDKFEKENIAGQQAFQSKAAGARVAFETSEHEKERASKESMAAAHETGATAREHEASTLKLEGAKVRAAGSRKPVSEFTHRTLTEQGSIGPPGPDGKPTILPGRSYDQYIHRSGESFVSVGDMLLPHNDNDTQFPDPKTVARAPAAAIAHLMKNPTSDNIMEFRKAYNYIPKPAMMGLQQLKDKQSDASLPAFVPKGTTAGPMTPVGGQGPEQPDTDYQEEPNDYANTGDNGPQASDNTPAP